MELKLPRWRGPLRPAAAARATREDGAHSDPPPARRGEDASPPGAAPAPAPRVPGGPRGRGLRAAAARGGRLGGGAASGRAARAWSPGGGARREAGRRRGLRAAVSGALPPSSSFSIRVLGMSVLTSAPTSAAPPRLRLPLRAAAGTTRGGPGVGPRSFGGAPGSPLYLAEPGVSSSIAWSVEDPGAAPFYGKAS
ncbi:hypothetical protein ACP70R_030190 [Stipagrostis hirtigluma subsp. patula]